MTRLTDDELKALKAGATKGPWRLGADLMTVCTDYREQDGFASPENFLRGGWAKCMLKVFPSKWISQSESVANGNLSAAAPDLLDEVLELRAKVKAADEAIDALRESASMDKIDGQVISAAFDLCERGKTNPVWAFIDYEANAMSFGRWAKCGRNAAPYVRLDLVLPLLNRATGAA